MSEVSFIPIPSVDSDEAVAAGVGRLADALGLADIVTGGLTYMLKTHFGERGNSTFVPARWIRPLIERVQKAGSKVFLADTNTLDLDSSVVRHGVGALKVSLRLPKGRPFTLSAACR